MNDDQRSIQRSREICHQMTRGDDYSDLEEFALRLALVIAIVFALLFLGAFLDMPSETDAAAAVALDLNDAINTARAAAKEQP